jgi:hypothetical protein
MGLMVDWYLDASLSVITLYAFGETALPCKPLVSTSFLNASLGPSIFVPSHAGQ